MWVHGNGDDGELEPGYDELLILSHRKSGKCHFFLSTARKMLKMYYCKGLYGIMHGLVSWFEGDLYWFSACNKL